jgi:hypothetical protein
VRAGWATPVLSLSAPQKKAAGFKPAALIIIIDADRLI